MQHGLRYEGGFERNFRLLKPGATTFRGSDGREHAMADWPADVDGVRIGYMEGEGKRFFAVRVQDAEHDIILHNEVRLDPTRHLGVGKRFSAEPTVVHDEAAHALLGDMIARNHEQESLLGEVRARIPHGGRLHHPG